MGALWGTGLLGIGREDQADSPPLAALQGAPPLGLQATSLLLSFFPLGQKELRIHQGGGNSTLGLGKGQTGPGLEKLANSTLSPCQWRTNGHCSRVGVG